MRVLLIAVFLLAVLLSGCASLQTPPPKVEDKNYLDLERPKIELIFPYELEYISKKSRRKNFSKFISHKLKSSEGHRLIFIDKYIVTDEMAHFSESSWYKVRNVLYKKRYKNGFSSVGFQKETSGNYIFGQIVKPVLGKDVVEILIYGNLGDISEGEDIQKTKKAIIDEFISETESICSQLFENI